MIGTIRGPSSLSRMRFRRIRVKTIVVETAVSEPLANSGAQPSAPASDSPPPDDALRKRSAVSRGGSGPPRSRDRGGSRGAPLSLSSGIGSSSRSRKTRSSASDSFLIWWVDVPGLDARAERPALHRLREDRRSGAPVARPRPCRPRTPSGSRDHHGGSFARSSSREVLDQPAQPRIGTQEVLADVGAASTAYFWNSPSTVRVHLARRARRRRRGRGARPTPGPR